MSGSVIKYLPLPMCQDVLDYMYMYVCGGGE